MGRFTSVFVICLLAVDGLAADKALLVGIGEYQIEQANLKGIDLDLEQMRRVALAAGYTKENTVVLADRDATLANFRIVFHRELIRGVSAGDRVLIYFSGHGTQVEDRNGDEKEDHTDEALMMHDTRKRYSRGKHRLENVLIDDEIEDLLADIPTSDVLVLVDACHSGTVTRYLDPDGNADLEQQPKTFLYEGMPTPLEGSSRAINDSDTRQYNYVALTASRDDQLAIATPEGSIFTRAMAAVIRQARDDGRELTLSELHVAVRREIRNNVVPERVFTPQLSGDTERAGRTMVVNLAP